MAIKTIITIAASASVVAAQSPSISDALQNTSSLSTLTSLLLAHPQVLYTLGNATNVTVFAPSNSALEPLSGSPLLNDSDFVTALLSYHAYNGTIRSSQISSTPLFPRSLLTNDMYSNVTGGQVVKVRTNGDNVTITSGLGSTANVTTADVAVSNGIVHIIDNYLTIPASVSTTASEAALSALTGALETTNLTSAVDSLQDVTVFAPSNAAFSAIGSALGSLNATAASTILQYHVINNTVAYSSLLSNTTVPTLQGNNVTITVEDNGAVFVNQARVISADVLVAGGVVHVIDSVLNPSNDTASPNPNSDTAVVAFAGASSGAVPYTTAAPTATTTIAALTQSNSAVNSGVTAAASNALGSAASSISAQASSTASGGAALPTQAVGAVGAAALFGAAAFFADF